MGVRLLNKWDNPC